MKFELKNITKYYNKHCALNDFSTTLTDGIYGLLGPNGAGKTTLINIIIGLNKANNGQIYFDGKNVNEIGVDYLNKIGYLPQYPNFYSNFSVYEFLEYMCALKGISHKYTKSRINEVLEQVNLVENIKKKIGALSGGMRQRLGIAQAIINQPDILILDEPTSGLDPAERIRFRNVISKLSNNKIVIFATHIVSDVEHIAKEVIMLKEGKLILQGSPEVISKRMEGKVWNVESNNDELPLWIEEHKIVNIKRNDAGFDLRIISDNKPEGNANSIKPGIEDVFLSIFGNRWGMFRLILFELRKSFIRKYILIFLVTMLILNFFVIQNNFRIGYDKSGYFMPRLPVNQKTLSVYDELHKELDGKFSIDKIKFIIKENDKIVNIVTDGTYSKGLQIGTFTGYFWSDFVLLNKYFYKPMKYMATYPSFSNEIIQKAKSNVEFYSIYKNAYQINRNKFILNSYKNREIMYFYETKSWESLIDYRFSELLILLLSIISIVSIYHREKASKMYMLILTSKNWKTSLFPAKLFATLIYVFLLVLIFSLSNFIIFKMFYGLNGVQMPVYSMEGYKDSFLNCSVLTFYLILQLIKILGVFSFAGVLMLLSLLFKRIIYPFIFSTLLLVFGLYLSGFYESTEPLKAILSNISPFTLFKANELFRSLFDINIFDKIFVPRIYLALGMQSVFIAITFLLIKFMIYKGFGYKSKPTLIYLLVHRVKNLWIFNKEKAWWLLLS